MRSTWPRPQPVRPAPGGALEAARRHPASTLVVDESAIDFLPDPAAVTLVGAEVDNVIIPRSTGEFHGIAAARNSVAWCRDRQLLRSLFGHREALPLSGLDVVVAEAALASGAWAADARRRLAADAARLDATVRPLGGRLVDAGRLPYRCILSDSADEWADTLAGGGVLEAERPVLATALGAVHPDPPALSEAG